MSFFTQYAFINIKTQQNDPAAARAYLDQAERDGVSEAWVYDFVRGVDARRDGDRYAADDYFVRALQQGGRFSAFEAWIDNRLRLLAQERASQDERFAVLQSGIDWGIEQQSEAALRHVGEILWDDYEAHRNAYEIFRTAYEINPSPEAARLAFGVIGAWLS